MAPPSLDQVRDAVLAFLNAPTWLETKRVVEAQADVLLTDSTQAFLADLIDRFQDDPEKVAIADNVAVLLRCCLSEA